MSSYYCHLLSSGLETDRTNEPVEITSTTSDIEGEALGELVCTLASLSAAVFCRVGDTARAAVRSSYRCLVGDRKAAEHRRTPKGVRSF